MTNTEELKAIIVSSGLKLKAIAAKMKITPYSLSKKINNCTEFSASEIDSICSILGISKAEQKVRIFLSGK